VSSSISSSKKLVLLTLSIAAILFCGFLGASEWLLRTRVVRVDNFHQQLALYRKNIPVDIVAFGDSHIFQDFVAGENMLNLGMVGESFELTTTKLHHYLKKQTPKIIILQLSPHMFAPYRLTKNQRDYDAFFGNVEKPGQQFLILDPVFRMKLAQYWKHFFFVGDFKSRGEFTAHGSFIMDHNITYPLTDEELFEARKRVHEHTPEPEFKSSPTSLLMRNTIEMLKKRGVEVCLVTLAVTPVYREYAAQNPDFEKTLNFFAQLARDTGVLYFSYWNNYDDYTMFSNQDHLNRKGAGITTKDILGDCRVSRGPASKTIP